MDPKTPTPKYDYLAKYLDEILEDRHRATHLFSIKLSSESVNEAARNVRRDTKSLAIKDNICRRLQQHAERFDISTEDILLFAWHTVLSVFFYSTQTVVGIELLDGQKTARVVPHLLKHQPELTVQEMLHNVTSRIAELIGVGAPDLASNEKMTSVIDNLFRFNKESAAPDIYPLVFNCIESKGTISNTVEYAVATFKAEDILRLLNTLEQVVQQVGKNSSKLLKDIVYISETEQLELQNQQILNEHATLDLTIVDIFEQNALEQPDKLALIFEDKKLTYKQLDAQANQLANYILKLVDVKPETVIAFCLERSELVLVSMLGIWKTGAAFLSLDSRASNEQIAYILNDSKSTLILSDQLNFQNMETISQEYSNSLKVQNLSKLNFQSETSEKPNVKISPRSLAYIIYTSGTTGRPKGVLGEHRNMDSEFLDFLKAADQDKSKFVMGLYYHGFSAFIKLSACIFGEGWTLVLSPPNLIYDAKQFSDYATTNAVTQIFGTPSLLTELDMSAVMTLKTLVISSEPLSKPTLDRIRSNCRKSVRIWNWLGSSEGSSILRTELLEYNTPLTQAGGNKCCLILTRSLQFTPVGAIGELCVSGMGVTRGYLNLDKLTSQVFITNPFGTEGYERMFRTGDLGRRLGNGAIEYIGRRDAQVKIRGIRVELGAIETVICSFPGVTRCIALAKPMEHTDHSIIIAYVVGSAKEFEIQSFVNTSLPKYMLPIHIIRLQTFPLNANGKVNRAELLLLAPSILGHAKHIPPSTNMETVLCSILEKVLMLPKGTVGIEDNFLAIGGNSLLAVRVVNQLNKELGTSIVATHLFENNTVASFCKNCPQDDEGYRTIKVVSRRDPESLRLSFQQEIYWVGNQLDEGFNVPMFFEVLPGFSISRFNLAMKSIVRRHEVLRTCFKINDFGDPFQSVSAAPLVITTSNIQKCEQDTEFTKFIVEKFDLAKEYPIRVRAFQVETELKYIGILVHHITMDFWSRDIMLEELCHFYQNGDIEENLPKLQIQYIDYAQNQRAALTGTYLEDHVSYWKNALTGHEVLRLPHDRPRNPNTVYGEGKYIILEVDEDVSKDLKSLGMELGVTLYSVLLAGYYIMLHMFTKQDDILVGTPISCRNHIQLDPLIGFFMTVLPLRQRIDPEISVQAFIKSVWRTVTLTNKYQSLPHVGIMKAIGATTDPYKVRELSNVFFQVHESIFDKADVNLDIPLRVFKDADLLFTPTYDMDFSIVLDVSNPKIEGVCIYSDQLFDEESVNNFKNSFISVLKQFTCLQGKSDSLKICQLIHPPESLTYELEAMSYKDGNEILGDSIETIFTPPITDKEKAICDIWSNALGRSADQLGLDHDFFQSGGNGLIGTKVLAIMKTQLGMEITLRELYLYPTIKSIIAMRGSKNSYAPYAVNYM